MPTKLAQVHLNKAALRQALKSWIAAREALSCWRARFEDGPYHPGRQYVVSHEIAAMFSTMFGAVLGQTCLRKAAQAFE